MGFTHRAAAFAASLCAGCSLLLLGEDFTGSPGGERDAATDARVDTQQPVHDATGDGLAQTDADRGAPDPCAADLHFCDDFERNDVLGSWTLVETALGGAVSLVKPAGGGTSLFSSIVATDAGDAHAHLHKDLPGGQRSHFVWTLDFDFEALPASAVPFAQVTIVPAPGEIRVLYLVADQGAVFFAQQRIGGNGEIELTDLHSTPGKVHRFAADVTIGGRLVVTVDGVVRADQATAAFMNSGEPALELGAVNAHLAASAFRVQLDNLRFAAF